MSLGVTYHDLCPGGENVLVPPNVSLPPQRKHTCLVAPIQSWVYTSSSHILNTDVHFLITKSYFSEPTTLYFNMGK